MLGLLLSATLGGASLPSHAASTGFPQRPIRLYVGGPAGGTEDTIARAASQYAQQVLGQPIIVESKSGAGGVPAYMQVKNAAPDGYTLGLVSLSTLRQPLMQAIDYDGIKDFTYISSLAEVSFGVIVPADSPFRTWADLLAFCKANPGRVFYGAPAGVGNSAHIFVEEVAAREGARWTVVPYRGSSDTMTALLGGQLTFSVDTLIAAVPMEQGGKVRILALATDKPYANWPAIPTMRQLGYDVSIAAPLGIGAPAGLPPDIVAKIDAAYKAAARQEGFAALLARSSQRPWYMDHQEFGAFMVRAQQEQRALLGKYGLLKAGSEGGKP